MKIPEWIIIKHTYERKDSAYLYTHNKLYFTYIYIFMLYTHIYVYIYIYIYMACALGPEFFIYMWRALFEDVISAINIKSVSNVNCKFGNHVLEENSS